MNLELFAHVKPQLPGENKAASIQVAGDSITDTNGSHRIDFTQVVKASSSASTSLYEACCSPMVDVLVSGYNASVFISGTTGSAKNDLLNGDGRDGIFDKTIEGVFTSLEEDSTLAQDADSRLGGRKEMSVYISVYEIDGDSITDLLSNRADLRVEEDAAHGFWVKMATSRKVYDKDEAGQLFRSAWQKHKNRADNSDRCTLCVNVELSMTFDDQEVPHRSQFTFFVLPTIGGTSSDMVPVEQLIYNLAQQPYADRVINYEETPLTKLLEKQLGGNCMTSMISCFVQTQNINLQRKLLKFCQNASEVKQFPVINDGFAQRLMTQYRANIIYHRKEQPPASPPAPPPAKPSPDLSAQNQQYDLIRLENGRLLEQIERLQLKLDQMNSKFGMLASAKTELSAQLVESEDEKLRTTKSYVDLQIENNRLKEELESSRYELTNKIMALEHELQLSRMEIDRLRREAAGVQRYIPDLEVDRKQLADEYINLKKSCMELADRLEVEIAKNDELTMELLNLINAKTALAQQTKSPKYREEALALAKEEERIRGVVHRLSTTNPYKFQPDKRRERFENEVFGDNYKYQDEINRMKEDFSANQKQFDDRIESLTKDLTAARLLARERQQKISFLNARVITLNGENAELKSVSNRLQHKIKDMNTEYRLRLTKYVEDVASHMDNIGKQRSDTEENMAKFVNKMIKDMKAAYKSREEQLSQAAQSYKSQLEKVIRRHEELLCSYRDIRSQVEVLGMDDLDLGPDEYELILTDPELHSSQQKEILRLQSELHRLKINKKPDDLPTESSSAQPAGILKKPEHVSETFSDLSSWTSVRKQLREFSESSLRQLEAERASLMSKNVILEEQLKESQEYIDKHLARYKEEINRLRQQLAYYKSQR